MFEAGLIPLHCNRIAIVALGDTSMALHSYHFPVRGTIRIQSLSKSNVHDISIVVCNHHTVY